MKSIVEKLHLDNIIRNIIKLILKLFWIFPVRDNDILFFSYGGTQYSCNPKYISQYISSNKSISCNIIWAFTEPEKFQTIRNANHKVIKYGSLSYFKEILTSKLIITNNNLSSYLPIRKKQIVINTWHGGGAYKKLVLDEDIKAKQIIQSSAKVYDIFISPCKENTDFLIKGAFDFKEKILEIGYPRNDIFFSDYSHIKEKVYQSFHIKHNTNIAIYAPTFRENMNDGIYDLDTKRLIKSLENRSGGKWIVMIRGHHRITNIFDSTNDENIVNATDYPDMQELLCAADLLITDYSSSIWDFSLMYKPSILFAKDLEHYVKERGFYIPIEEWHFPIVKSNEELIDYIKNFDEEKSRKNIEKHLKEFGSFETGRATEIVVNEIKKIIEE